MLVNNLFRDSCKDQITIETHTLLSIEERELCLPITAEVMKFVIDISVVIISASEII
jgi:hypothetical protein